MAPQFTTTAGLFFLGLRLCIARAKSSFPVPLSPSIRTVVRLSATSGSISNSSYILWFFDMISSKVYFSSIFLRSFSTRLISLKVSTAPIISPSSSFSNAVDMLIGVCSPAAFMILATLSLAGSPVFIVCLRAQLPSHISAFRTSLHS